jgi:hypothetical protein
MRAALPALLLCLSVTAHADPSPGAGAPSRPHAPGAPERPHGIGKFGQWQAATHKEGDGTTCFAFTRAEAGSPHIPGRGDVVLSVTRRPRSHDVVAISAGFVLSGHEDAPLVAGNTHLLFYIANRSAFAHDNAAAIATFTHESSVMAKLPGPHGVVATDHFSLKGFSAALAAMQKACTP